VFSSFPADLFLPITPFTKKRKRPSNTKHIDKTQLRKYKPQPAANLRQQLCRARSISFYSSLYYVIYEQSKHAFPTRKYGGMNLNLRRQLWRAHSISFYCFSVTPSTNKQGKCFSNTKHIERTPIWKYKSHPASTIVARTFNTLLYFSITASTNKKRKCLSNTKHIKQTQPPSTIVANAFSIWRK
jgi:hypothetical protein